MCEACQKFPRPENILSLQTPALNKELDKIEFQASKLDPKKTQKYLGSSWMSLSIVPQLMSNSKLGSKKFTWK